MEAISSFFSLSLLAFFNGFFGYFDVFDGRRETGRIPCASRGPNATSSSRLYRWNLTRRNFFEKCRSSYLGVHQRIAKIIWNKVHFSHLQWTSKLAGFNRVKGTEINPWYFTKLSWWNIYCGRNWKTNECVVKSSTKFIFSKSEISPKLNKNQLTVRIGKRVTWLERYESVERVTTN